LSNAALSSTAVALAFVLRVQLVHLRHLVDQDRLDPDLLLVGELEPPGHALHALIQPVLLAAGASLS